MFAQGLGGLGVRWGSRADHRLVFSSRTRTASILGASEFYSTAPACGTCARLTRMLQVAPAASRIFPCSLW
eukprot:6117536-Pyramimonas_sp.AAC.1